MLFKKILLSVIVSILCLAVIAGACAFRVRGSVKLHSDEDIVLSTDPIYYRQDDASWASDTLGSSSFTLKSSGCLVSCIASAVSMSGESAETPKTLNDFFSAQEVYDSQGNLVWEKLTATDRFEAAVYNEVTADLLLQTLREGNYPIVRVRRFGLLASHYVLIVEARHGMFYCIDPLAEGLRPLSDYGSRVYAIRCVREAK